jgi:hydrogenase maturation factor
MLGVAEQAGFVSIRGARPGNVIIQVGAAPIEGAAVLVAEVAERLGSLSPAIVGAAALGVSYPGISVVEAALAAAQLGATAMHDPTEGGLAAGLHEVASAAGVALRLDRDRVIWFEPGLAVCHALGADRGRCWPQAHC